jgi:hypothetical protein
MLEPIFATFEKLVVDFSWRRALHVILVVVLGSYVIYLYGWYTGYFDLNRIQKSTQILAQLQDIESKLPESSPDIRRTHQVLAEELRNLTYPRRLTWPIFHVTTMTTDQRALAFLFGIVPWSLVCWFGIKNARRTRKTSDLIAAFILFSVALFFGWLGSILPASLWPWLTLAGYPVLQFILLGIIGMVAYLRSVKNT